MDLRTLLMNPRVRAARRLVHSTDEQTLRDQLELVAVPAPSGSEHARAAEMVRRFRALGLGEVEIDDAGNVVACLPTAGRADPGEAPVIVSAHLDTVFPAGAALRVRRAGGRIHAPGIADNARGLTALLALARVLRRAALVPARPLIFVATVGEEGEGNLRGARHLFRDASPWRAAAASISLDGAGAARIVHRAVGSTRLRLTLQGPGGHSWADAARPNPIVAAATLIRELVAIPVPSSPRSTLAVTRIGGGTSINAIPAEAWFDLDLRSESADVLRAIERHVRAHAAERLASAEATSAEAERLTLRTQLLGSRPAGAISASAPLVRAAVEITRLLGGDPVLDASSTDANVPISLGIPAITIGAGGQSGGVHTTAEWYGNDGGAAGIERALLITLAVAGIAPPAEAAGPASLGAARPSDFRTADQTSTLPVSAETTE